MFISIGRSFYLLGIFSSMIKKKKKEKSHRILFDAFYFIIRIFYFHCLPKKKKLHFFYPPSIIFVVLFFFFLYSIRLWSISLIFLRELRDSGWKLRNDFFFFLFQVYLFLLNCVYTSDLSVIWNLKSLVVKIVAVHVTIIFDVLRWTTSLSVPDNRL